MPLMTIGAGRALFKPPPIVAAASPPAWLETAHPAWNNVGFGSTSATFTAQSIGAASSDRVVVVGVAHDQSDSAPGTLTIGGVSATRAVSSPTDNRTHLFYLAVASGTTANIVYTSGTAATLNLVCIGVGILTGVTAAPTSTDSEDVGFQAAGTGITLTVTNPTDGIAVAFGYTTGGATPATWSNATADGDYPTITGTNIFYLAVNETDGSQGLKLSGQNINYGGVAAAWGA